MSPATDVLYIAGLGRSGTTLVERTLGRLLGTVPVGEVVHLWERGVRDNERCGCGVPFDSCAFWGEVGALAYGGWDRVDLQAILAASAAVDRTRYVPRLRSGRAPRRFRAQLQELQRALARLYPAMIAASGARVVLDSSKNPSYAYLLRSVPGLRVRAVQAIRDPRAVAYSWSRVVERPDAEDSTMARWSPARTSLQWAAQNALAAGLARSGVATTLVRYEDFTREPAQTVRRLAHFADLAVPDEVLAELAQRRISLGADHTVSGNPLRFHTGSVEIRTDEAWRRELSRSDARLAWALTAPVRIPFGYRA